MDDAMDLDSESDFYGDEPTVNNFKAQVNSFNVANWWQQRGQLPPNASTEPRAMRPRTISPSTPTEPKAMRLTPTPVKIKEEPCSPSGLPITQQIATGMYRTSSGVKHESPTSHAVKRESGPPFIKAEGSAESKPKLYNPYADIPYAWQLTESVDSFLARLPPSTTQASPSTPWIFICNPYSPPTTSKASPSSSPFPAKGCEDEAPIPATIDLPTFLQGGTERLHILSSFIRDVEAAVMPAQRKQLELQRERDACVRDILRLAHVLQIRCGKWMLFVPSDKVDAVWAVVARETAAGTLGVAAKVAPRPEDVGLEQKEVKARLICVYTRDFIDKEDIKRVLMRLRELGVTRGGRQIWYKADAYTYLGIAGGNPWGLKASIYGSNDFLVGETGWTF